MKQILELRLDTTERAGIKCHRQDHHLHAEGAGHGDTAQLLAAFAFQDFLSVTRVIGMGEVADLTHRLQNAA